MSLEQQTNRPQTLKPTEARLKLIQANIANQRKECETKASQKRLFKLLMKTFIQSNPDTYVPPVNTKEPDPTTKSRRKMAFLDLLMKFRGGLKKK